jgi:hypothetical protein
MLQMTGHERCYRLSHACNIALGGFSVQTSTSVLWWWGLLCAIGTANIIAWTITAKVLRRRQGVLSIESYYTCRAQLLLSAFYVFGCAFRSFVPVFDVPRITLFNTWLSSVAVGRSVATIAEVCFVAQWALMLRHSARLTESVTARVVSYAVVPMILIAECFSWYSVLTTDNIGHVVEESLWGVSAALLVVSMVGMWPRCAPNWRPALIAGCAAAVLYVAYMFYVDVPMYWSRWLADEAVGRQYFTIYQGVLDVSERRIVSHRWEDWKSEVTWMSLYFSVAVWISIALIHATVRSAARRRTDGILARA